MENKREEVRDFLKDAYFVSWVNRPDEKSDAYWKQWIALHPEQRNTIKIAREMISSFQYQQTYRLPQEQYDTILRNLRTKQISTYYLNQNSGNHRWFLKTAATILLLIGAAYFFWQMSGTEVAPVPEPITEIIRQTQKGEKLTFSLPDGSRVRLNANSKLTSPSKFTQGARRVSLEGEALFEVTENQKSPFIIVSGDMHTRVLGTSFNVRAYQDEANMAVAVVSGKVSVQGSGTAEVFLKPNEVSFYNHVSHSLLTRRQDISDLIAWSKDILIFDKDSEQEVWKKLENWYGVNIIVQHQPVILGNYSGRFHDESLERVLLGISYASEFAFEIRDNKDVVITKIKGGTQANS
jgi:ferric-dicitrate binding protein FerR (iron transport regulator)